MSISDSMRDALNAQVNAELYSAYLYQSMSAWAVDQGLKGLANWMGCQAREEVTHALKIANYVQARGGRLLLTAIDAPETDWDSAVAVAENTLAHEQKVTGLINGLVDLAIEEKDHATQSFLTWFVDEQVEEEESAGELLERLQLAAQTQGGMLMIDRELARRSVSAAEDDD
jgi:ferritin